MASAVHFMALASLALLTRETSAALRGAVEQSEGTPAFHLVFGHAPEFCLSLSDSKLQLWECDKTWRSSTQQFLRQNGTLRLAADPTTCVVSKGTASGAGVGVAKCDATRKEDKEWNSNFQSFASSDVLTGPWDTCLAVDGKARNGADLELLDYNSCVAASQYWVQAFEAPSTGGSHRSYAVNPAFSAAGFSGAFAASSGCSGAFEHLRSAEDCAAAAGKLDRAPLGPVEVVNEPNSVKGCFVERKSTCGQAAKLKFNTAGKTRGSFESCDVNDCCHGITSFCML